MKNLLLILAMVCLSSTVFAQAKKPTLMIVPSDAWCFQNDYILEFDNQGSVVKVPNYKQALQENIDLINVISKVNGLMAERGFPLKNLETVIKSLEEEQAEDAMLTSKDGDEVAESPIDALKKKAKADIILQLTWDVLQTGPKKSVRFNLQGLDSYSNKQVATAQGTGAPSFTAEVAVLLEEAVVSHMDNFTATLQDHFNDMFENGREITLRIKVWSGWGEDLESEFDDDELSFIIEDWMDENTVKGRFSTTDATESMMYFEQVRIPLYDKRGRAMDARRFTRNLYKFLKEEPYEIPSKMIMKGLGQATLILGGK